MDGSEYQRTIARPASVAGFGYWSGRDVRVEFRPALPGTGIVFVRGDLPGCPRVEASIANRLEQPRRTTLQSGEARVEMVEHVMASLSGLGVDNCEVWVDQPEMPGCDGSCLPFVHALEEAGLATQSVPRRRRVVRQRLRLAEDGAWFEVAPPEGNQVELTYHLDYGPHSPINRQTVRVRLSPPTFRFHLAPARTFLLKEEADWMLAQGLGTRATPQDLLIFAEHGLLDNELRFPDECARHKLTDLVGDLALAGCQLVARITAYRTGHKLNARLVGRLLEITEGECMRRRCA
ncbi:MAG TPA: UDP-3-O-[3-hydroxymyristoyl] N-acetylglucosamine deacetylase [Planctomycetes bacterium]|nr:UDP-3-O-[3-hydroxymyristoyl] N-acetylglucosamine deacetylase [Planctomycetota bacterium]